MKSTIGTIVFAIACLIPLTSSAQTTQAPLTRAQVRGELTQLEAAGYRPIKNRYPADIQAAEARVATQSNSGQNVSGIGGSTSGASQAGSRAAPHQHVNRLYAHH
jgi:hypothetical protein